jgi:hypothetical protein
MQKAEHRNLKLDDKGMTEVNKCAINQNYFQLQKMQTSTKYTNTL